MKLNIGGQQTIGRFPSGWTCVDILAGAEYYCDISKEPLPIPDASVEAIYFSHCLEHIWPYRHSFVLSQFMRVLIPGGKIRVVVPDMQIQMERYAKEKGSTPGLLANCMSWWFDPTVDDQGEVHLSHVCGFDWWALSELFGRMAFSDIRRMWYGMHNPVFQDCDNPGHQSTSLYLEAVK